MTKKNAVVSLDGRHVDSILSRKKRVELRRRRLHLSRGDTLWIYRKMPGRVLVAKVLVKRVEAGSPTSLWNKHGGHCGITRRELYAYFRGVKTGYAIVLGKLVPLPEPISLDQLREKEEGFHPPQFGKYLTENGGLLPFLRQCAAAAA